MATKASFSGTVAGSSWGDVALRSDAALLRALVVVAGICSSALFVVIGLHYELEMYADGSLFSYAVAVQDAWAFHWHNIAGRLFVHLFSYVPAETYVALTRDARGGIAVYGFLFFAAQLFSLAATWAADRSKGRIIFGFACLSTACLCPLVFGFPTEMWMAHALFWPALAVCHYARAGLAGIALVFAVLLALVFTHEGALIFAIAIVCTLLLRGSRDAAFRRAAGVFLVVVSIWALVKAALPPDDYTGTALRTAVLHAFDITILTGDLMLLLLGTLASYGFVFLLLRRLTPASAHVCACAMVAVALAVYWLWFDHALHAENRYYLRTVIVLATPVLGALAALFALDAEGRRKLPVPIAPRVLEQDDFSSNRHPALSRCLSMSFFAKPVTTFAGHAVAVLTGDVMARAITGAFLLVMLMHAVETAKFVTAWTSYQDEVRRLATGTASDPALGDPRFVSSERISTGGNRLGWSSTTHFLSVLVAPQLAPARLVVDPQGYYFWLSCKIATANEAADRAVPVESRRLVRAHACLHRH
jgi:hypothetical protein